MMSENDLAGPTISDRVARTLVHYTARGELQRLDTLPEIAAVELLDLPAERRQQTWAIIETYRNSLKDLLIDQIDLLKEATDAQKAKDYSKVQQLYRELYDVFNADHERDVIAPALMEVLTADEQADVARLVDDYWTARVDWEVRNRPNVTDAQRQETQNRLVFAVFQQQVGQAYQTSLRPYQAKLDSLYNITDPTDEQRTEMRALVVGFIRDTRLVPTPEQIVELAQHLLDLLDEAQRVKVMEYALSRM